MLTILLKMNPSIDTLAVELFRVVETQKDIVYALSKIRPGKTRRVLADCLRATRRKKVYHGDGATSTMNGCQTQGALSMASPLSMTSKFARGPPVDLMVFYALDIPKEDLVFI